MILEYYKTSNEEYISYVKNIENEIYNNLRKEIIKKQREIATISVDLFKKKFWFEKGEVRSWNKIENEHIDHLFKDARNSVVDIFDLFKQYKLIKNPLKRIIHFFNFIIH